VSNCGFIDFNFFLIFNFLHMLLHSCVMCQEVSIWYLYLFLVSIQSQFW